MIHSVRPAECRIYPFNFEYDFNKEPTVKVFVAEDCDGARKHKPFDKSKFEQDIKDYLLGLYKENITLKELEEETEIIHPHDIEERKIREIHENFKDYAKKIDELHVSKKPVERKQIRDFFLEKQIITCLNEEGYKSYLNQVKKQNHQINMGVILKLVARICIEIDRKSIDLHDSYVMFGGHMKD